MESDCVRLCCLQTPEVEESDYIEMQSPGFENFCGDNHSKFLLITVCLECEAVKIVIHSNRQAEISLTLS